jgi:hypothetical protein
VAVGGDRIRADQVLSRDRSVLFKHGAKEIAYLNS